MDSAEVLRNARRMTGLSQAEVALRAGTSQQTVARYERGASNPTVTTLNRLLAACGLILRAVLEPQPGLEDRPTQELLALPPAERLPAGMFDALHKVCASLREAGIPAAVGGRCAARLHGAVLHASEADIWVDWFAPTEAVLRGLKAAGLVQLGTGGLRSPVRADRERLRDGVVAFLMGPPHVEIVVTAQPNLSKTLTRAEEIGELRVASPEDIASLWRSRDIAHLALQRAVRIRQEQQHQT